MATILLVCHCGFNFSMYRQYYKEPLDRYLDNYKSSQELLQCTEVLRDTLKRMASADSTSEIRDSIFSLKQSLVNALLNEIKDSAFQMQVAVLRIQCEISRAELYRARIQSGFRGHITLRATALFKDYETTAMPLYRNVGLYHDTVSAIWLITLSLSYAEVLGDYMDCDLASLILRTMLKSLNAYKSRVGEQLDKAEQMLLEVEKPGKCPPLQLMPG
ncbi:MAG TPA: hypothetical protein VKF42_07635 [Chitinivibrionales bacterium]|nr:hypothetical protein [Chitinivibrionales bacterium]